MIFLEHGWFKEYESVRVVYNRLLHPDKNGGQLFTIWGRGHYKVIPWLRMLLEILIDMNLSSPRWSKIEAIFRPSFILVIIIGKGWRLSFGVFLVFCSHFLGLTKKFLRFIFHRESVRSSSTRTVHLGSLSDGRFSICMGGTDDKCPWWVFFVQRRLGCTSCAYQIFVFVPNLN